MWFIIIGKIKIKLREERKKSKERGTVTLLERNNEIRTKRQI